MEPVNRPKHTLVAFMEELYRSMQADYERIRARAVEDPGTAGDEGEERWAELLRNWLPATYSVVTKGRIINTAGETSPQVDVLVLHPAYPKYLRNQKLYLADGVIAAFECKLTLKRKHLRNAVETGVKIKHLYEPGAGRRTGNSTGQSSTDCSLIRVNIVAMPLTSRTKFKIAWRMRSTVQSNIHRRCSIWFVSRMRVRWP